jgi:hypothetical protein
MSNLLNLDHFTSTGQAYEAFNATLALDDMSDGWGRFVAVAH